MSKSTQRSPGTNPDSEIAPKQRPAIAEKIRQGKVELSDDELTKVSGGQHAKKMFTQIE